MKLNSTLGHAFWQSLAISSTAFWISPTAAFPDPSRLDKQITQFSSREYATESTNATSSNLLGDVFFVGYDNYAFRDDVIAAQMVISANASSSRPSRLIVAFPEGNTGFATYFIPTNGTGSAPLQVVPDIESLSSITFPSDSTAEDATNQTGITCDLSFTSDMSLGVTLIGSIRTVRDYTEGSGLTNEIFNYTLGDYNATYLQLVRPWINGTTVQYLTFMAGDNTQFSVIPSQNVTLPPTVAFERTDKGQNGSMSFKTTFNYTDLPKLAPGLDAQSLFLTSVPTDGNGSEALTKVVEALQGTNGTGEGNVTGSALAEVKQVSFLTYQDKFLAGGWRFLTYFGRDTLLTLRLLLPTFTSTAAEAVLTGVMERINGSGLVCHEETIGDYASFVNIQNNQSELGAAPSYNYVMADTDYLLLPSLSHYFLSTPQGANRSEAFLDTTATLQNGTYRDLLLKNVDHVINMSKPFASNTSCENLVHIRDTLVGNWRDSGVGLGYGKIPFDINTAFVPSALRAIVDLSNANVIPFNYSSAATPLIGTWETAAAPCFEVTISGQEAQSRLDNYVQQANLSQALLSGVEGFNATDNVTFYALSLDDDGSPVEVLNSDLGFTLLYGNNVPTGILQATVNALQPYPKGLLTNVGMVVANAAYDSNTTNIAVFDETAYHGAVVWSWQQALMAAGLAKQLDLCGLANGTNVDYPERSLTGSAPTWCNTTLASDLQQAQVRLWDSIGGSSSALFSEVYTPLFDNSTNSFTIGDLGAISPTGTEGDAIQLWAYAFLAAVDPRSGRPVASGLA
ncbi:hypothetical protein NliqN6_4527 [Naganishia liquefaciens]|uniref:Uncharacterized protein n=1 Tax=Naganishia liquefaciens TaxID=104408 RepID=A0A8H3TWM1_9TREE|nr:hypothetical protein NliqN6_4527 [Naganishia liquefaciens]